MNIVRQLLIKSKFAALLILFSLVCSPARAIVNMESVHLGKPQQGFSGVYELSVDAEYGNTEKVSAATGLKLQWSEGDATDVLLANYAYGESAGVRNKNKAFVHARHIQQYTELTAWEIFSQLSNNEFTSLTLRALVGGGARLTLDMVRDKRAVYLGLGGFYEREQLDITTAGTDETSETLRGNVYLVLKYPFNAHVSLLSSTYYQPAMDEFSDFRTIEDASLESQLTDDLSLSMGANVQYDSRPPPGVEKTDTSITVGLKIHF